MFQSNPAKWLGASGMFLAAVFLVLATYFFTTRLWGPAILALF
jgi:hypothetical protein